MWWATIPPHPARPPLGQLLHGGARTTEAVRRAIQRSQLSAGALAERHGINRKTVAKWRRRATVTDAPMGPKAPRSTVLSAEEEATVAAFRRHTLLPLDDCLCALQPSIPHPTRSSLHRCLQRHGISRLPEVEGEKPQRRAFKHYPIGFIHVDIAEVRTGEGKLYLFVAVDRTPKVAYAELHERAKQRVAGAFLEAALAALPYRVHTVLTDNGVQFTNRPTDRRAFRTPFQRACRTHGIEHRTTRPNHPWTNGQVERMNRTLKEATVRRYHYGSHAELREHLKALLLAYNFAKRLKTLRGLTPYEFVCAEWSKSPERFIRDPTHHTLGPYT